LELTDFFLNNFKAKYGKNSLKLNKSTFNVLRKHSWPGNVRELEHTIEKAVILCQGSLINSDELGLSNPEKSDIVVKDYRRTLKEIEKQAIVDALNHNIGNLSEAAKELKITRQTLYNKISKYRINL
ncbi:MAG: sigma-54-dependent Fis family transcriptional regulator, partial [Bacteroidales bacterium]|nr:sigma-54-dependent Fis family transcriptional regulator [Bacteroidales bacterium]